MMHCITADVTWRKLANAITSCAGLSDAGAGAWNRNMFVVSSVMSVYLATTTCEQTTPPAVIRVSASASLTSALAPPGDVTRYQHIWNCRDSLSCTAENNVLRQ